MCYGPDAYSVDHDAVISSRDQGRDKGLGEDSVQAVQRFPKGYQLLLALLGALMLIRRSASFALGSAERRWRCPVGRC